MSAWIVSLPILVGLPVTIAILLVAGISSYALARCVPADQSDESALRVSDHMRRVIGVLLGLMLSTVFAFSSAQSLRMQDSVEVEAAQLGDLHHDLSRIQSQASAEARDLVDEYLEVVVRDEWPALIQGRSSPTTHQLFL